MNWIIAAYGVTAVFVIGYALRLRARRRNLESRLRN